MNELPLSEPAWHANIANLSLFEHVRAGLNHVDANAGQNGNCFDLSVGAHFFLIMHEPAALG